MTGSGTIGDPYIIYNVTDLQAMQNDLDAYYELANNIDASATSSWNGGAGFIPIGQASPYFTGHFDGKEYAISSLFINRPSENSVGLFGDVEDTISLGIVKNVKLVNVNITGKDNVGALVGYASGTIIQNCSSTGTITGDVIGGLIGFLTRPVTKVWSSCAVNAPLALDTQIGGLVGALSGSLSSITKSFALGNVTGSNTSAWVGGFVGDNSNGTISDCYARGSVVGNELVGGFCGQNSGTISNSYSTGAPSGSLSVGGFCGDNTVAGTITNCFWDTQTSGQATSDGGTGKTTAQMKTKSTFTNAGWDFVQGEF